MAWFTVDNKMTDNDKLDDGEVLFWCMSISRLSNTHPRAIQEGTTDMKRCETLQMSLLPAKYFGGLTAPKTNMLTAWGTAEQRLSTHIESETGMEVRSHNY